MKGISLWHESFALVPHAFRWTPHSAGAVSIPITLPSLPAMRHDVDEMYQNGKIKRQITDIAQSPAVNKC